ncbi:alpha/beta hydrolase [Paenibacillus sp. UMB4589-SE434]|uniref:alpha/beta fold hydrolase n=1 Tax=Paenibacillus sp. UMB4589-SE434 TaxID=3046314 RepID=UPI00254D8040|nr:alpha/beta hydrolase [Paenibacillus sp. UMB4589-SE434]MDK8181734.1 alpha/beta hydrolase [Paenibacillus sp. UMB4589-SE434]
MIKNELGHFTSKAGEAEFKNAYNEAMALIPKPNETKDIQIQYGTVRVYYFTEENNRDKEPIVLLPGRSASTPMWEPNLEGLMKERPIYAIDLLGEPGMSIQTAAIDNRQVQAEWLNQVLEELNLVSAHIVGVSIGGWIAINLARYYPERIASISLLDPVFVFAPISLKMIALSIPASVSVIPQAIREKMLSYISGGAKADESEPIAKLIESAMRNYKLKLPAPDRISVEDLKKIDLPILALMAENSIMHNSKKAVQNGKKYVKDIDIESWPNASHAITGEYPEEINNRMLVFVKKHSRD